ncbi:alpha/beta hydrolase [Candidatus Saccharibacteria bacterium]|nr:alpha/beta hydrolase [Candidatus Saccharibacteria bacterium]
MFDRIVHRILGVPYRLHAGYDRQVSNPRATVVFIHGIATDSASWENIIKDVESKPEFDDVRLVCLDLLGFGDSPAPEWSQYSTKDHVRSIVKTMKKLRIQKPAIIVAHSMGALLATEYVAKNFHPVKKMLLVAPPFLHPKQHNQIDKIYKSVFNFIRKYRQTRPVRFIVKALSRYSTVRPKYFSTRAFDRSLDKVIINGKIWHSVAAIDIPTIIIAGVLDPLIARANIARVSRNPHITVVTKFTSHDIVGPSRHPIVEHLTDMVRSIK